MKTKKAQEKLQQKIVRFNHWINVRSHEDGVQKAQVFGWL